MLFDGEVFEEPEVFRHDADDALGVEWPQSGHLCGSGCGFPQACQDLQGRRLTCTVRTQQRANLPASDVQVESVKGAKLAIAHGHGLARDHELRVTCL